MPRLKAHLFKSLGLFAIWMGGQVNFISRWLDLFLIAEFFFFKALWLYFAYELEFNGQNTFLQLWFAGLIFLVINCAVLKYGIIDAYKYKIKAN